MSDFDNPWKDVLEHFFHLFLAFFFPEAHAAIDWARNYESLDKELQQIVSESELGLRLADKLFKVWLKEGDEIEIQIVDTRQLGVVRKPGREELLKRLRAFRGRLPADFKFDRDDANAR